MIEKNLYWPIYKNLEKEVLLLADSIYFCDEQIDVYSVKIAEVLLRASAELESLIKDLYRKEKKHEPETPGKALIELNKLWKLDRKIVDISALNMYFQKGSNRTLAPFQYNNGDKNDFYSIYNAVKHDRAKNISKANIRILLNLMAALYLLNLYFKDEKEKVRFNTEEYDLYANKPICVTRDSDIFSVYVKVIDFPSKKPSDIERLRYSGSSFYGYVYLQIVEGFAYELEWKRIADNTDYVIRELETSYANKNIIFENGIIEPRHINIIAKETGNFRLAEYASKSLPNLLNMQHTIVLNKSQFVY